MTQEAEPGTLTPSQHTGLQTRRVDHDRTLEAIHHLEAALDSAAPGRETAWRRDVLDALATLAESTAEEHRNAEQPESILSDIARTQPRLRTRVRGLRIQYRQLRDTIESLHDELTANQETVPDTRQRVAWLITALRHQRSRESDLIYEAYYEAFNTDIETAQTP